MQINRNVLKEKLTDPASIHVAEKGMGVTAPTKTR
jgi:hypothetical protein